MSKSHAYSRAGRILVGLVLVHALLVATHLGEFWPFSIYQMFSSAGRTWTRALVREVHQDAPDSLLWAPRTLKTLPGRAVALGDIGVSQDDLSVFLERTGSWTPERRRTLTGLLRPYVSPGRGFLIFRVRGRLSETREVRVSFEPVGLITEAGFDLHPGR